MENEKLFKRIEEITSLYNAFLENRISYDTFINSLADFAYSYARLVKALAEN